MPVPSPAAIAAVAEPPTPMVEAVVLVVLDGVRWQEIFQGADARRGNAEAGSSDALLPHLYASVRRRGILFGNPLDGETFAASGPNFVSMPGYTEIFTGRPPTGCGDNACPQTKIPTLVDELRAKIAARDEDVAVISSWESIRQVAAANPGSVMMSTGRRSTDPRMRADARLATLLEQSESAGPWPGTGDYRPDAFTAQIALRYLEVERPRFLFVGLGDTDEHAHHDDYKGYLKALAQADAFLGELTRTLERMGSRGERTAVFVTADHGRAESFRDHGGFAPESGRVWLAELGPTAAARARARSGHLSDIAPRIRELFGAL